MTDATPKRLGFSAIERSIEDENELILTSVGIDIGSSTSHLLFSRLRLERRGSRYETVERSVLRESNIMLTPFSATDSTLIDGELLGEFIEAEYEQAGLRRDEIDTGAIVLTGLAVQRNNAREIGNLFAEDAGRFVTVTAGDSLEATMAAYGSGAVAASQAGGRSLNIDIGGGTTKLAVCIDGRVRYVTAIDVGARLVTFDDEGRVTKIETPVERYYAPKTGVEVKVGERLGEADIIRLVEEMARAVVAVLADGPELAAEVQSLLRAPTLPEPAACETVIFSGGVSEYLYGREPRTFGDLGVPLARAIEAEVRSSLGPEVLAPASGIRATAMGASQHTMQVSGSTIFISPLDVLPLKNVPVIAPQFKLDADEIDSAAIAAAVRDDIDRLDVVLSGKAAAVAVRWQGSASYARLDGFARGVVDGMQELLDEGSPLILVMDGDVGGLLGMHLKETVELESPVISIDGVDLHEFDFIDVGVLIPSSGAVPVVIKSLIFPAELAAAVAAGAS